MDIRLKSDKEYKKIQKEFSKSSIDKTNITITLDPTIDKPLIMVKTNNGELVLWTIGIDNILSFLKYGYVRIRKKCPFKKIFTKCRAEKCQWYHIRNNTGDCAVVWKLFV